MKQLTPIGFRNNLTRRHNEHSFTRSTSPSLACCRGMMPAVRKTTQGAGLIQDACKGSLSCCSCTLWHDTLHGRGQFSIRAYSGHQNARPQLGPRCRFTQNVLPPARLPCVLSTGTAGAKPTPATFLAAVQTCSSSIPTAPFTPTPWDSHHLLQSSFPDTDNTRTNSTGTAHLSQAWPHRLKPPPGQKTLR